MLCCLIFSAICCIFNVCRVTSTAYNSPKKGGSTLRNSKQTSARAATAASKVLRDGRTGKASKIAAASALAQRPSKKTK
nr:MAG TPA: hypothetical protein [Caudoviricetes sp.]